MRASRPAAILAQTAAEMLGLPVDKVDVRLGDTDLPRPKMPVNELLL